MEKNLGFEAMRRIRPDEQFSLPERWGKQMRHVVIWLGDAIMRGGRRPPVVVAYPDLPSRRTTLYKVCRRNRWELTNIPRPDAMAFIRFEDATHKATPMPEGARGKQINAQCTDISKRTLDLQHQTTFGYGVNVDPCHHEGWLLEKSNDNAAHDGVEKLAPLAQLNPSKVYQRIVNNRDDSGRIVDLRLVYVNGLIPVVYRKYKSDAKRYSNETTEAQLADAEKLISPEEQQRIAALMESLGVEFAELDGLRDQQTDQLFIVDVNPTAWGPPAGLAALSSEQAIERIAVVFRDWMMRS